MAIHDKPERRRTYSSSTSKNSGVDFKIPVLVSRLTFKRMVVETNHSPNLRTWKLHDPNPSTCEKSLLESQEVDELHLILNQVNGFLARCHGLRVRAGYRENQSPCSRETKDQSICPASQNCRANLKNPPKTGSTKSAPT